MAAPFAVGTKSLKGRGAALAAAGLALFSVGQAGVVSNPLPDGKGGGRDAASTYGAAAIGERPFDLDWADRAADPSLLSDYAALRSRARVEAGYRTLVVPKGSNLTDVLIEDGASAEAAVGAVAALGALAPLDEVSPGTTVDVAFAAASPANASAGDADARLTRLRFYGEDGRLLTAERDAEGWKAAIEMPEVEVRYAAAASTIPDSLFAAGRRAEVPREVLSKLANMFLYDVDFARDIRRGDRFEVVYEVRYDADGTMLGTGDIVFAAMTWRGGTRARGYYLSSIEGEPAYFDVNGQSARRMLMKTPIEGARVTSGFGTRRHPISGYTKQHKGVDFGAHSGTPIMAAGDGIVEQAGPFGTYGNYVRIRHQNGYETAYAHMSGFAPGMRAGARVRQGDVIGYVGTTGRSTGPHLHYEVTKDKVALNPMTLEVANGRQLDGERLEAFEAERARTDALRGAPYAVAAAD
ncbi:M23 family metallopeptidase [Parvularcula dongshanensis]|uniref:Murein DD-endopeptidase MepM/ murein hydrolase activator NlpD n=1 Tax=Parvularcula dongshanensis TaxID=1173995 RepID=A0A840I4I9_9PROT|nr:M23 family metallopeptidase [Parvularcula dongshanensis]MBB4658940.1 murein DD-endopeptidase MepM/ murein hydrolase activator NlpD [Parvularcula dongshanensis]